MSNASRSVRYTVSQFMDEVKVILKQRGATDAGLGEIASRMKTLSTRDDLFEQGEWREPTRGHV